MMSPLPERKREGAITLEWEGEGLALQCLDNANNITFGIVEHPVVPERNDAETLTREVIGASSVIGAVGVLAAFDLNHQASFQTPKVDDEGTNPTPSAEFRGADFSLAQGAPKDCFGAGRIASQFTGTADSTHRLIVVMSELLVEPLPFDCCAMGPFLSRFGRGKMGCDA